MASTALIPGGAEGSRRRAGTGAQKLAPIDQGPATAPVARKIFSKKDLVESVRKMTVRCTLQ